MTKTAKKIPRRMQQAVTGPTISGELPTKKLSNIKVKYDFTSLILAIKKGAEGSHLCSAFTLNGDSSVSGKLPVSMDPAPAVSEGQGVVSRFESVLLDCAPRT